MTTHAQKIKAATDAGLRRAAVDALFNLARSARWYADDHGRIDKKTFVSLREEIDEAEALWKATAESESEQCR